MEQAAREAVIGEIAVAAQHAVWDAKRMLSFERIDAALDVLVAAVKVEALDGLGCGSPDCYQALLNAEAELAAAISRRDGGAE